MKPALVDVTRTISRAFKPVATGIDRVERAYIAWFSALPDTLYAARLHNRIVVLDPNGMAAVMACIDGRTPWDKPSGLGAIWSMFGDRNIGRNATLRRHAKHILLAEKAPQEFRRIFPGLFTYFNVGHTNLDRDWLTGLKSGAEASIAVLVHDMIPMDTPEFQTEQSVRQFEARMRAVAATADWVIASTMVAEGRIRHWFGQWGRTPDCFTAHLGISPLPRRTKNPLGTAPYFVALGTIEPRKNHQLLLDAWHLMEEADRPLLHIVGTRGWKNENVLKHLDTSPLMGRCIFEHGALPDDRTRQLLLGATALVFPSLAEGFGLPVLEALQMNVPVIATRLPTIEELVGDAVLYIDSQDAKVWATTITQIANSSRTANQPEVQPRVNIPCWEDHFRRVLSRVS